MTSSGPDTANAGPVERFKPSGGFVVGYAGLVFVAAGVGYVAFNVHTVTGLRVALGLLFFGVVIWVTQLRSRASAYPDRLVLKNSVRDAVIPLVLIEDVSVRQTLNVWVGERRYVCTGIGDSLRAMFKSSRRREDSSPLGGSRWREFAERAERAAPDQSAMSYETFVVTRIQELVDKASMSARKQGLGDEAEVVQPVAQSVAQPFAWPEIVALAVTGAAFVVSVFL